MDNVDSYKEGIGKEKSLDKKVKRGFVPTDAREFYGENLQRLQQAQQEILYLLDRGYPIKSASTFVGNHYLLSERQRLALVRATGPSGIIKCRQDKKLPANMQVDRVNIDGLNLIITLEVALSESTLIKCMDGTIRDLAGLRGTYRLIDKTDDAIVLIGRKLEEMKVKEAVFYLDSPVSNTGRLKARIQELLADSDCQIRVEIVTNPDVILASMEHVITGDAIILNQCSSWINLAAQIVEEKLPGTAYIPLNTVGIK